MYDSLWPHGLHPTRLLRPWNSSGKTIGVGCHSLLHRVFPTQGSNPGLLHCRQTLYHLSHQGSPIKWIHMKTNKNFCLPSFGILKYFSVFFSVFQPAQSVCLSITMFDYLMYSSTCQPVYSLTRAPATILNWVWEFSREMPEITAKYLQQFPPWGMPGDLEAL